MPDVPSYAVLTKQFNDSALALATYHPRQNSAADNHAKAMLRQEHITAALIRYGKANFPEAYAHYPEPVERSA